jgi:hypothetical protein
MLYIYNYLGSMKYSTSMAMKPFIYALYNKDCSHEDIVEGV